MPSLTNITQFASDFANYGLSYAVVNGRINTPEPLDPEENWNFWVNRASEIHLDWLFDQVAVLYPPEFVQKAYLKSMLERDHAVGINAHYSVSNDFYALFLDNQYRFYSGADFLNDQETLEEAQTNKAKNLLALLQLQGNERVLDLGCGWGSMLKFLKDAGHQGELAGITLSNEQFAYIQTQFDFKVHLGNFITEPLPNAPYDRIYSIGSLEHLRPHELEALYRKLYDALVPGGLAVHQLISLDKELLLATLITSQLIFPGSVLVLHTQHLEAAQKAGFKITHDSVHKGYPPTLKAWHDRLGANRDKALTLVDLKTYNRYLTYLPLAWLLFQNNYASLHRIVIQKPIH